MDNPFLVEVTRGHLVESRHRGSVSVVDAEGATVLSSAMWTARLSALRRQGAPGHAAGRERHRRTSIGLTDEEIALACASHSGEPEHVAAAGPCSPRPGGTRPASNAACIGPWARRPTGRWPRSGQEPERPAQQLLRQACGLHLPRLRHGEDPKGYVQADHPVQRRRARGPGGHHRRLPYATRRAASTAARSRPTRSRSRRSPSASPGSAPESACRAKARPPPRGSAGPWRAIPSWSPAPAASTPS